MATPRDLRPRLPWFVAVLLVPILLSLVAHALSAAARRSAAWASFLPAEWITTSWRSLAWMPVKIALGAAAVLAVEAVLMGWPRSAARRLFVSPSASARTDLFYFAMRAGGGIDVLAMVFSFGTCFWVAGRLQRAGGPALIADWPLVAQFVVVYVVHSFAFYWAHRLMHTRWLWELHKVHHAAESLNGINAVRNHPIDRALMVVLHAVPAVLLGASPVVIMLHANLNAMYQMLVHTEINLTGRFWDRIWITPAAHRLHHANDAAYFDHNFGILTVWDRLFRTYHPPISTPLTYGVEHGTAFNSERPLRELFANVRRWLIG